MREIGIAVIGGGYMGKAHSVAMNAVAAIFDTPLRPRLEVIAARSDETASKYAAQFGFRRGTGDWRDAVADPAVEAVVIASPQSTHREISEAAFARGLPVMCEKPLGRDLTESEAMVRAAEAAGVVHMCGFNYVRTPATQFARQLLAEERIGEMVFFRGEHTEDFFADIDEIATWRSQGRENGCMGDLAPHPINCALALAGPITELMADVQTVHATRPGPDGPVTVTNDDQASILCKFASGATGHLYVSRVAHGKKMGYTYEITGTKGAIRFDQEDQNALWLYTKDGPEAEHGFRKILTGPLHPDYLPFCQGPGHGTGYQDQIIIEAKDFLEAIAAGQSRFPTFRDGMEVNRVVEAAHASSAERAWRKVAEFGEIT